MEKEKLEEFNEWWFTEKVPGELLETYKRNLFYELKKNLEKRQIISVVGLRRTGKTTIMYQLIDFLLAKMKPVNILYFSFDEEVKDLRDVLNTYREIHNLNFREGKFYVFLDEIQKLNDWQNQVKKYYDLYPRIKFIISGSEGLFLRKGAKETLAGRIYEFTLPTLSFVEFLDMKRVKHTSSYKLRAEFVNYVKRGGFPEMVFEENLKEVRRYVRSSVIDKIVFKDMSQISSIKDLELLGKIIELIATNPGMYLEYRSLAQQLQRDRRTIKEYVMWINEGFIIKILGNYRKGSFASLRKRKRVYVSDTGIITAFKPVIDEHFFSKMVETAVINSLGKCAFWKNSYEVDAVVDGIPLEVKYKEAITNSDLRGIREFMRKFSVKQGTVVTKNTEKIVKTNEGKVTIVPAWKWLFKR